MFGWLAKFIPAIEYRKVKTIEAFVAAVEEAQCTSVDAAARLDSPGLLIVMRGSVGFFASPPSGRTILYEETLFENAIPGEKCVGQTFVSAERRVQDLRTKLPDVTVTFDTLFVTGATIDLSDLQVCTKLRAMAMRG